jgi:hypothetical protein
VAALKERDQLCWTQMLDDLECRDASERLGIPRCKLSDPVGDGDLESAFTTPLDHVVIEVHAADALTGSREEFDELTSTTADIEDVVRLGEKADVDRLPVCDLVGRATQYSLKPEIVEVRRLGGRFGRSRFDRCT